jgi:hypothetical protein
VTGLRGSSPASPRDITGKLFADNQKRIEELRAEQQQRWERKSREEQEEKIPGFAPREEELIEHVPIEDMIIDYSKGDDSGNTRIYGIT